MRRIALAAAGLLALASAALPSTALAAERQTDGFELPKRPYTIDRKALAFTALPGAMAHTGVTRNGAGYRIEVPDNWNGDTLIWLRGGAQWPALCDPATKQGCTLPQDEGLGLQLFPDIYAIPPGMASFRETLIAKGYAWIVPVFRDYRITPKVRLLDAVDTVEEMKALRPTPPGKGRFFLVGFSLGGLTVQHGLEMLPDLFAGGIAGCVGETSGFVDFWQPTLAALGLAAEHDPVIADYVKSMKWPLDLERLDRLGPRLWASLGPNFPWEANETGLRLRRVIRTLSGGGRPLADAGFDNVVGELVPGYVVRMISVDSGNRSFIDNSKTEYRFETAPGQKMTPAEEALNRRIPRFTCDPAVCSTRPITRDQARNLGGSDVLTARPGKPMMQLLATGDMQAYFSAAQRYAARVKAAGSETNMVSRAVREKNHCGFTPVEWAETFDDLVKWADTGIKPPGDDILSPEKVRAPDFGCTYTRGQHSQDWQYANVCKAGPS